MHTSLIVNAEAGAGASAPVTPQSTSHGPLCQALSVEAAAQLVEHPARGGIPGRHACRRFELAQRVPPAALEEIDPSEVHERELARLVAPSALGLLEPRDGLVELALGHEIDPDVVVRVAEVRVKLDGAKALPLGLLELALKAKGPAEEGVRLRRGAHRDGTPIALDGLLQLAIHLVPVGLLPELRRAAQLGLLVHP